MAPTSRAQVVVEVLWTVVFSYKVFLTRRKLPLSAISPFDGIQHRPLSHFSLAISIVPTILPRPILPQRLQARNDFSRVALGQPRLLVILSVGHRPSPITALTNLRLTTYQLQQLMTDTPSATKIRCSSLRPRLVLDPTTRFDTIPLGWDILGPNIQIPRIGGSETCCQMPVSFSSAKFASSATSCVLMLNLRYAKCPSKRMSHSLPKGCHYMIKKLFGIQKQGLLG